MHICILLAVGCAKRDNKAVGSTVSLADVQAKRDLYLSLQESQKNEHGWLESECDALLSNSLAAYAGLSIDISKAEEQPGRWRRHPDFSKCLPGNGSKSTISKDMMRGLLLYLWKTKDLAAIERIQEYGSKNNWVMGEAEDEESYWGRVVFWPLVPQIKDMSKLMQTSLQNAVLSYNDEYGYVVLKRTFEAHLHVLNIYLRAQMYGGITDYELAALKEYSKFQPRNALFSAMAAKFSTGDYSWAIALLLDERMFPKDRLPASSDRCTSYLWSKEAQDEHDYFPCDEGLTHPGIDLTFVVKIMEE